MVFLLLYPVVVLPAVIFSIHVTGKPKLISA